ncbi:nitroreductase family protein [Paracidobacterium acidisoli]|uniref:Nitroreductase family protein n=1 Tax=Paracidobacterium acidisoli TaxID=2303751 RepID=A0A372ITG2_9BACT|nr:nitroreductase family protein [Paracidobacterium acidisoli]MBT9329651.1 nitroreductase family protein [Paracidobacterium acidisoli]
MANLVEKTLTQAIEQRRATPSFDGVPVPATDLKKILEAGLHAPSGYNMQPWRFVVVSTPEQRRRLRGASFNQAKIEEAPMVIVACGDADGWRSGDLEEMLRLGREGGMTENYAEQAAMTIPEYLGNHPNLPAWLNKQVMLAFTTMMLMAEVLGYDTAPMEGFEADKVAEVLKLPLSYQVVALLAIGHLKGQEKFNGGRFSMARTVFDGEYGKPLRF